MQRVTKNKTPKSAFLSFYRDKRQCMDSTNLQSEGVSKQIFIVNRMVHLSFGKEYFYLIKEKKVWPFTFREFQVMGLEIPDDRSKSQRRTQKKLSTTLVKSGEIFVSNLELSMKLLLLIIIELDLKISSVK